MNLADGRLSPAPGTDGIVSRSPGAILFVAARTPVDDVARLLEVVRGSTGDAPGRQLARQLAILVGADDDTTLPAFALVASSPGGTYVRAYGAVEVRLHGPAGEEVISAVGSLTGVDRELEGPFDTVVAHRAGEPVPAPLLDVDLQAGSVPPAGSPSPPRPGRPTRPQSGRTMPTSEPRPVPQCSAGPARWPQASARTSPRPRPPPSPRSLSPTGCPSWARRPSGPPAPMPAGPRSRPRPGARRPRTSPPSPSPSRSSPSRLRPPPRSRPSTSHPRWTCPLPSTCRPSRLRPSRPLRPLSSPPPRPSRSHRSSSPPPPRSSRRPTRPRPSRRRPSRPPRPPRPPRRAQRPGSPPCCWAPSTSTRSTSATPCRSSSIRPRCGPPTRSRPRCSCRGWCAPAATSTTRGRGSARRAASRWCSTPGAHERPPATAGVMVFEDGATFSLSTDYVVGRQPEVHDLVQQGLALPITVDDPERSISRAHAELRLVEWDVHLVNLSGTNGSFVWDETSQQWIPIPEGQSVQLTPGMRVALGRRSAVFESSLVR